MDLIRLHVDYVTEPERSPDAIGFLLDALGQPGTLPALAAGAVVVLALVVTWARWRPMEEPRRRLVERAASYVPYVPWMLRLSAGLVLIGAGLGRVLFVPILHADGIVALALTAIGFLLLLGFAVRPAAIAGLAIYFVALVLNPTLVLMFDVAGALAAVALLGPGAPGLDDMLSAAFPRTPVTEPATRPPSPSRYDDLVPLLVRIGLGGAFVASGIVDKLVIYDQSLAAVEQYGLTNVVPVSAELWVVGAAVVETGLGIAILLGVLTRFSVIVGLAVLTLAIFALPPAPVIAHVGLFGLSSVLVVLGAGRWSVDRWFTRRFAAGAGGPFERLTRPAD